MYDTEKRVELVKKRVHEKYRRKKRRGICQIGRASCRERV